MAQLWRGGGGGGMGRKRRRNEKLTCHISGRLLIFARSKRTASKRTSPGTLGGKNASSRDMIARGDSRQRRALTAATGFRRVLSGPVIIIFCLCSPFSFFPPFFLFFLRSPQPTPCETDQPPYLVTKSQSQSGCLCSSDAISAAHAAN